MKKCTGRLLMITLITFAGLQAFAGPVPPKYTSFLGKGTGFSKMPAKKSVANGFYTADFLSDNGIRVRMTVQQRSIAGDTAQALIASVNPGNTALGSQDFKWTDLYYNHYRLRGASFGKQEPSAPVESFFLLPASGILVTFEFFVPADIQLSTDVYRSGRNVFLAQYTHHING